MLRPAVGSKQFFLQAFDGPAQCGRALVDALDRLPKAAMVATESMPRGGWAA